MKSLSAAACGAVLMAWTGTAQAASKYPKPEDFTPVGAPQEAAADSGPERHQPATAPDPHFSGDTAQGGHGSPVALGHGAVHEGAHGDGHGGDHHFHRNHVALFGGIALHDGEVHPVAGLDWCFRITPKFGAMAMAEVMFGQEVAQMYGAGATWHVTEAVRLALVPAVEIQPHHTAFLLRLGAEYGFHVGSLSFGPSAALDYVSGHVIPVFGVAVGSGF